MEYKFVKFEVLLPEEYIETIRDKLNDIGVLTLGHYDNVLSYSLVKGYWRPLEQSKPYNGLVNEISFDTECKMEFRCLYTRVEEVKGIIKAVHPYEEPVVNIIPLLN
ncbi:cytochrome C biogenesis protein (plasmid) [Alkalihalophilus pseudofirmus]|uniref:cytochrome C biogenesis protein n=1 Tax=Alkalihalophilus pseudofirmus TaxID=79885 RepID=UPI00259B7C8D|nr:cytochrome C biogenesis protein [Alkalihalophilus pseudofirmus]WEG19261.1 cytochrome C biogenesis protein [Alkalihalophilus pseudofirmus]